MPPAPRKVGRPEEAERPAPRRARMRVEDWRCWWKESRSAWGIEGGGAVEVEEAIVRVCEVWAVFVMW